jgi:hypothetical protein
VAPLEPGLGHAPPPPKLPPPWRVKPPPLLFPDLPELFDVAALTFDCPTL